MADADLVCFTMCVNFLKVLEGPARYIFCILNLVLHIFLEIHMRVCEDLPVIEFAIFSFGFLMISVKMVFIWVLWRLLKTSFGQRIIKS